MPVGSVKAGLMSGRAIPDSDVYLHDDWGDNKLQDRDDSGTTTYNGVEGVYRPEWTIENGSPQAANDRLEMDDDGQAIHADININLSETLVAEFDNIDLTDGIGESGGHLGNVTIFAESTNLVEENGVFDDSYSFFVRDSTWHFRKVDSGGVTNLIDASAEPTNANVTVTRSPAGEWELFIDGNSQGTETDTTFTDPQIVGFSTREDRTIAFTVDEAKWTSDSGNENGGGGSIETTFAITSDGHYGSPDRDYQSMHGDMLSRMDEEDPEFIIHPGDISNGGSNKTQQDRIQDQESVRDDYLEETDKPYTVAHGNHDSVTGSQWQTTWGVEKNHTWEHGNIGFIVLDSADDEGYSSGEDGSTELAPGTGFLSNALDELSDKDHVFVVSHYWFSSDLASELSGAGSASEFSTTAVDMIHGQPNVSGLIHGHNHGSTAENAYLIEHDGVTLPYIMGGVFGGTTSTTATFGYRIVNIYDDGSMDTRYMDLDGNQVDSQTL